MDNVTFSPSFKGKFLNPNLVRRAARKSQHAYMDLACKTGNKKLETSNLAKFDAEADEIIKFLNELAAKLPDNLNLVLSKLRGRDGKTLCLDAVGPFGKTEFMGDVSYCRESNTPYESLSRSYDLDCVKRAIEPLRMTKDNGDRTSLLWPPSTNKNDGERIVRRYIARIEKRIENMIKEGRTRNVPAKIEQLAQFAEDNGWYDVGKRTKESLLYKLKNYNDVEKVKKENRTFKHKTIFNSIVSFFSNLLSKERAK